MSLFKKPKAPSKDTADDMWVRQEERWDKAKIEIDALVPAAEIEALAKADEIMAEAIAEHQRDCAGYKFECRRWGDFLSLFLERRVLEYSYVTETYKPVAYATAVNIGATREVRFIEGSAPDSAGVLKYHKTSKQENGAFTLGVTPDYPNVNPMRSLFGLDQPSSDRDNVTMYMDHYDYQPRHKTLNYPRMAVDDRIRFEGIGATIYIPSGRGHAVYDEILREIARAEKGGETK